MTSEELGTEQSVRTLPLLDSMSMMVAPVVPTVVPLLIAEAPVYIEYQYFRYFLISEKSSYESNGSEVSKLDKRATLFEILNDPLGVVLAEITFRALTAEGMCHSRASCD